MHTKRRIYFAPLEGITGHIFRNAYNKYYKGVDSFYAPFISPYGDCAMTPKERRDVDPANNEGLKLIPQILANDPVYFAGTAAELAKMGYDEININIGCPSGTVCSKKKGAGLLSDLDRLDGFLGGIFDDPGLRDLKISVKTRIGFESVDEFGPILDIYNKYPLHLLIIHPRLRKDMYKGGPRMDIFKYACENSKCNLIYNGDICRVEDLLTVPDSKNITGVMIGRGILKDPLLPEKIAGLYSVRGNLPEEEISPHPVSLFDHSVTHPCSIRGTDTSDVSRFLNFHNEVYESYKAIISPDLHVLFRMKELWSYWISMFPENKKEYKNLLKSKKFGEYDAAVRNITRM